MKWYVCTMDNGLDQKIFLTKWEAMIHVGAEKCTKLGPGIYETDRNTNTQTYYIGTRQGLWLIGFEHLF